MGKFEVTAGQYTAFLNAVAKTDTYGLYNTSMDTEVYASGCNIKRSGVSGNYIYTVAPDWANRPVCQVSYWDSCRFANWLSNGQPTGAQDAATTERGAYILDGYTGQDGRSIVRNAGWTWAVTSKDEWYKAAYYDPRVQAYWGYPTGSDVKPSNVGSDGYTDPGNSANYRSGNWTTFNYTIGAPYYRTNVGEFENSASPYGTFDQGGNVSEWNEAIEQLGSDYAFRGIRGGSYWHLEVDMWAMADNWSRANRESTEFGFRVVQLVPEPSSLIALGGGLAGLLTIGRRRRITLGPCEKQNSEMLRDGSHP